MRYRLRLPDTQTRRAFALLGRERDAAPPCPLLSRSCSPACHRPAFTLVEMLVAIGIFIILATLTIGAFRTNSADRISAATGTFKNALEGARSRAVKSGQVRGLRLIQDPVEPRIVTSLVYIGSPEFDTGIGALAHDSGTGTWVFGNNDTTTWETLEDGGFLNVGNRIEIPANSGNWYTITPALPLTNPPTAVNRNFNMGAFGTRDALRLAGHYQPSTHDGTNFFAIPNTNLSFRLELSPATLPGSAPILLPRDTCIDLDGSVGPWRDTSGDYDITARPLDVLFSPRGVITGRLATEGVVRFRIASVSDMTLALLNSSGQLTTGTGAAVVADPEKGHRAVGVFTQTGGVVVADFLTPGDTNGTYNNELAPSVTSAYQLLLLGREGRQ